MIYDHAYVELHRQRAVTDVADIKVGGTYFGRDNSGKQAFVISELLTNRQSYERSGLVWSDDSSADDIAWFIYEGMFGDRADSLRDCNIGASYNPWLIFADQQAAIEYYAGLEISWERGLDDFDWLEEDADWSVDSLSIPGEAA